MSGSDEPTLFRPGIGKRGMNEMHYAAYCGDRDELERALGSGLDPNTKDTYRGYAAIHWLADMAATDGPRMEMLRVLVERGADISLRSDNGETALSLAVAAGSETGEELAMELKRLGACE
jgi:ankyrin repeat protein